MPAIASSVSTGPIWRQEAAKTGVFGLPRSTGSKALRPAFVLGGHGNLLSAVELTTGHRNHPRRSLRSHWRGLVAQSAASPTEPW